jgi:hypothetical protein
MPVTLDKAAPYASPQSIIEIIERHRSRGLPSPITAEVLGRAGIPDSLIPRTLQALQSLDLTDEAGNISEVFESIRLAPEAEYQDRLLAWLNAAYADVLTYVDPANDDETKIRDAFRSYRPTGQQSRMVTLFVRLYAHAGLRAPKPVPNKPATPHIKAAAPAKMPRAIRRVSASYAPERREQPNSTPGEIPPAIEGLLRSLPGGEAGWTKEQRDKFLKAFETVLDFCVPIQSTALIITNANGG